MDRIADARWRDHEPPFDGLTLATGTLPSSQLSTVAARLVAFLRNAFGDISLQTAEDWLEHDGFVSEPEAAEWGELEDAVAREGSLREWSPEDADVRRAWLGTGSFYLRWHVDDDGGGDVDLTAARDVVQAALSTLRALTIEPEIEPADEFFSRRWNG
jgi:hypothetical protein